MQQAYIPPQANIGNEPSFNEKIRIKQKVNNTRCKRTDFILTCLYGAIAVLVVVRAGFHWASV